jgi:hypothetical protein
MPDASLAPLRWSAYDSEHVERETNWFWALGVIAISAAITSILFGNVLFAILIVVAAVVLGLIAKTPPQKHQIEISERGIRAGNILHRYEEILSFWVEEEAETPLLLVDTTKFLSPNLIIPLDGVDPRDVRALLREHTKEVPMREPIAHKVLAFFGF